MIERTRTFANKNKFAKSISKYLVLPLQIIPFSNRPFFNYNLWCLFWIFFYFLSKFVPFWKSFGIVFYSFKKSEFEKVSHSSFLCLSAHASPKALLPLRYLRAAHTRERNIPTLYIQFKKSTEYNLEKKKCRKESRTWSVLGSSPKWSTTQLGIDMRG